MKRSLNIVYTEVFEPFLKAYVNEFKYKSITTNDWKGFLYKFFDDKVCWFSLSPLLSSSNFNSERSGLIEEAYKTYFDLFDDGGIFPTYTNGHLWCLTL